MNGLINRRTTNKLIRKYQKELNLQEWDIDFEFNNKVKTLLYFSIPKKTALLVINKSRIKTKETLNKVIRYQLIRLKTTQGKIKK